MQLLIIASTNQTKNSAKNLSVAFWLHREDLQ